MTLLMLWMMRFESRTFRDLIYFQMFLDLILNEAVSMRLCFEIRHMYVYSMAGRAKLVV
jgi:hypothetical protein